jgi:hypothetical protein
MGQPHNWKDWAALGVAVVAGWSGKTVNRKGEVT